MKGGYLSDRFIQGAPLGEDSFYQLHWSLVDIFCYFSHHLVSIPPVGWINTAHRTGVSVIGTFITEWEAGRNICRRLFESESTALCTAEKLADIAKHYKVCSCQNKYLNHL
jgi:mannosyl-glycoprotein endo-beta-N-acetylglucosaminidase